MRLLLFGFTPFANVPINPAERAVDALAQTPLPGIDIAATILPVSFARVAQHLRTALDRHRPDAVLGLGLAAGRSELAIERVAVNLIDARIPDNDGAQPIDRPVLPGGPPAYFATLPVKAMAQAARDAGVPSVLSLSAGSFVCNAAFYLACHHSPRAGFIHLPCLPEQSAPGTPGMALDTILAGLRAALVALRDTPRDVAQPGGALY